MSARDAFGLQPGRNAFGSLVTDPDRLTQRDRVDVIRRLAGRWQASKDRETAWAGRKITEWLHGLVTGNLEGVLGLPPPQGSRMTAPAIVAQERRDRLLLALSAAMGGDRAALKVFKSGACPDRWADLVAELASNPPRSVAAFTRARQRLSRHR